jgi:anti-sigma factor RsiW
MPPTPENELFSAYLDGELTAAERAQVEQLLAADPAARQLLEELRKVSEEVRALPKQSLGEDLRTSILRQAERRMLTEESAGTVEKTAAPMPLARSIFRRFTTPRVIIWTTITVVFAIMIRLDERRNDARRRELAQNIAVASKPVRHEPVPPSSISAAPERPASEMARKAGEGGQVVAAPAVVVAEEEESEAVPQVQPVSSGSGSLAASAPSMKAAGVDADAKLTPKETATPPSKAAADAKVFGFGGEKPSLVAKRAMTPAAARPTASKDAGGMKAETGTGEVGPLSSLSGVLVVRCKVSRDSLKQQAFEKLLADHNIVWQEETGPETVEEPSTTGDLPAAPPPNAALYSNAAQSSSEPRSKVDQVAAKKKEVEQEEVKDHEVDGAADREKKPEEGKRASDETDWVYVEATPAQIEATLAGLAAQPAAFLTIAVQPAADDASQQALARFDRPASPAAATSGDAAPASPSMVSNLDERNAETNEASPSRIVSPSNAVVGFAQGFAQRVPQGGLLSVQRQSGSGKLDTASKSPAAKGTEQQAQELPTPVEPSDQVRTASEASKAQRQSAPQQQRPGKSQELMQRVLFVLQPVDAGEVEKK